MLAHLTSVAAGTGAGTQLVGKALRPALHSGSGGLGGVFAGAQAHKKPLA